MSSQTLSLSLSLSRSVVEGMATSLQLAYPLVVDELPVMVRHAVRVSAATTGVNERHYALWTTLPIH